MNLPTLKQLRYFVALEEIAHFGKAAESCFVSQSAFSVAIKELEAVTKRVCARGTTKDLNKLRARACNLGLCNPEAPTEKGKGNFLEGSGIHIPTEAHVKRDCLEGVVVNACLGAVAGE